jgi:hypothetical protein
MIIFKIIIFSILLILVCELQAQTNLKPACNVEILKETSIKLGRLSKQQMKNFLLTFEDSCEINVEYSEWSNELLFYTIL